MSERDGGQREETTIAGQSLMLYTSTPTEVTVKRVSGGIRGDILSGEGVSFQA